MKSNSRYQIYKLFILLRSKLDTRSSTPPGLVKVMSGIKDFAVRLYVLYVSRVKYSLSARMCKIDQEVFVNEVETSPKDIKFLSQKFPCKQKKPQSIKGGDWDILNQQIDNSDSYLAIIDALEGNKDLEDTQFFHLIMDRFENGQRSLGCEDKQSFLEQWHDLLILYNNNDLSRDLLLSKYFLKWEPVQVDIGRYGDLLLSQGDLSLIIAKLFNVQMVPVKILTRHIKWVIFRKRFHDLVTTVGSRAYQPPLHPDLMFIPAEQSSLERYEIIKRNLSFKEGRLLELGANAGFFSIKFEIDGFNCVAVESFPGFVFCLRGQRRALNKTFTIIPNSFLDREDILDQEFEVVLALNVLSHLIVHKDDFERLTQFLENLKCKEMFFEPYSPNDPQMRNAYVNMNEDEFADFVRDKLRLSRAELIGKASDKRRIYKIF